MASATLWSEEDFLCSICLDVFNSPVSTPCGHNFCRACITTFWDDQVQYKCPVCNELFHTRPGLRVNTFISGMVDRFRSSVRVKEQHFVEPGEVPCDVCTGTQLKAVKSCLMCFMSYCHTHLEPHQRVAGLKKHLLVKPTEYLWKIESEVQQMIQERQRKIQEIKDTVDRSKANADREIADGVQVLTALKHSIEKCQEDHNQTVKEKLKSTEKEAEGLIKELEQEIKDLTNRSSEVKQLSHTDDHLHFLQTFRSLKNPPHTRDWTTVEVRPPSYVGTLRRSLDQLEETLNMVMKKLPVLKPDVKKSSPVSPPTNLVRRPQDQLEETRNTEMKNLPDLRSALKNHACELTLDPNTAYRHLSLSDDNRKVMEVEEDQMYPDHPERFDYWDQVLCRESLTDRCYWEVEWEGNVDIGVTYRGITRRGEGDDSRLGMTNKSWSLYCDDGGYSARYNGSRTAIRLPPAGSNRVGVYLDRPAGTLSFYRVSPDVGGSSDTLTHIHTFQSTFTQEDHLPGFRLGFGDSVSLCRL